MVFIKHNSLKSDIFFNLIIIPCFSGFMLFRMQVFQGPCFSASRFLMVQVFRGPGFTGSRFFRVRVQVLEVANKTVERLAHLQEKIIPTWDFFHRPPLAFPLVSPSIPSLLLADGSASPSWLCVVIIKSFHKFENAKKI